MPNALPATEERRSHPLLEIAKLGDICRGSIQSSFRRFGKPNRDCALDDHPDHGPQVSLSYAVGGKTVQHTLPDPAERLKGQCEIAEFRRLRQLNANLVDVKERTCLLRHAEMQETIELPQTQKNRSARSVTQSVPKSGACCG